MRYHFLCHSKGFGIFFSRKLMLEESDFTSNFLTFSGIALMATNIQGSCIECWKAVSTCLWLSPLVESNYMKVRGNLMWIATTKFFFPIQILSFLAIQESLSVWPKFYSSSANVFFPCTPCSPAKPISSAYLFRFCPNLGKPTLWVHSCTQSHRHIWKFLP